jgi:hypothetical protein
LNNEEKKKERTNLDNSHLFFLNFVDFFFQYKYREDKSTITHYLSLSKTYLEDEGECSGVTRGEANGQLPISFGVLPIVIFINKVLPIEMSELTLQF